MKFIYYLLILVWLVSCQKKQEENSALVKNPLNAFSYESAKDWLDKQIVDNSDDDLLYYKRSQLYVSKNLYSLAMQDIDKSINLRPLPKYFLQKSKILLATDDTTGLLYCINQYERTKIEDFEFYSIKSKYLYQSGQYSKALQATNEGIALASFYTNFYRDKGVIYLALKDSAKGEKYLNMALELDSTDADNYYENANYYFAINQKLKSITLLDRGLKWSPNHFGLNRLMGDILTEKKLYDSALLYYNYSLASNPKSMDTHLKRAITYMHLFRYVAAEADLSKVLRLQPNNTIALKKMAISNVETGQYLIAEPVITKLYAQDSTDVELRIYKRVIEKIKQKIALNASENANLQSEELTEDTLQ